MLSERGRVDLATIKPSLKKKKQFDSSSSLSRDEAIAQNAASADFSSSKLLGKLNNALRVEEEKE